MNLRVLLNAFWVLLMLISLRNASVFLRLRSNHFWNSISCWSDSIQSNKTQASSTSPCGHSNTSFCASHTRLSHCRPCWLHSQSNIMAVFFFPVYLFMRQMRPYFSIQRHLRSFLILKGSLTSIAGLPSDCVMSCAWPLGWCRLINTEDEGESD